MAKSESLRLSQEQKLQQTLAPMQLQFVKMLEMNGPEVEDEVQRAIDENPALEIDDNDLPDRQANRQEADYLPYYRTNISNRSDNDTIYEPEASDGGESLMDFLLNQLSQNKQMTNLDLEIARYIIGNIDPNGYMTRTLRSISDDMAIQGASDVTDDDMRRVWNAVRELDPAGVGAVDLRDSILLQLKRLSPSPQVELAIEIVRDYFDLFSLKHYRQLQSLLNIDEDELREAIGIIRTLNPKPGAQISGGEDDRTNHISPDFLVETDGDRLTLSLLNNIPQLRIAKSFSSDTPIERKNPSSEQANAFIRQRRDEASGFIRALSMRQATLFRVMSAIMQWQREFFMTDDPATLRPMILKDISEQTGDDISVISRATQGKYVATNTGVYPLRFFFNEARDGDDASAPSVMARLRELIEAEDPSTPLTDEALTKTLASEGINIARRTVAKYRERMGIPIGRLRKRL